MEVIHPGKYYIDVAPLTGSVDRNELSEILPASNPGRSPHGERG